MHTVVKTFNKTKQFLWCVVKKQGKPRTLSRQKAICNGEKGVHECIGFRIFWHSQEYIGILAVHSGHYFVKPWFMNNKH